MDKDNANPTILNASQLPTRQKKRGTVRKGPGLRYDDIIFAKPDYLARPFCDEDSLWPDRTGAYAKDDYSYEPIDEQEIYGKYSTRSAPPCFASSESPSALGEGGPCHTGFEESCRKRHDIQLAHSVLEITSLTSDKISSLPSRTRSTPFLWASWQ